MRKIMFRWQEISGDRDVTGYHMDPFTDTEITSVRAWEQDFCHAEIRRNRQGNWNIVSSDIPMRRSWYRKSFGNPNRALEFLGARLGQAYVEGDE